MKPAPVIDSYARRSRKDRKGERTDHDLSTVGQHAVNLRRIEEYGGRLGEQLTEIGRSAWQPGVERPKFDLAVERLTSGAARGICIYDIDRMLRRVKDALRVVEIAEQGFVILDADGEYDLMTPNGREQFYQRAVTAEAYSFKLSKKVKRGFETKALLGEGKAGRYRPLGFEADATTVREVERGPIREACALVLVTRRWQDGADVLNAAGILTSGGNLWQPQTTRTALLAPRMAGHIVVRGTIVGRFPGEPILNEADWQELQSMVHSRSPGRPPSADYFCTGRVCCSNCGNTISGNSSSGRTGSVKYQCRRRYSAAKGGDWGCGKTIGDRDALDAAVGELVVTRLSDPRHASQVAEASNRRAAKARPHEKELGRLLGLRDYWDGQLLRGECDEQRHTQMTAALNELVRAEETKIEALGLVAAPAPEESTGEVRAAWDAAGFGRRREMFDQAFTGYRVFVDPGPTADKDFRGRVHITPEGLRPR